MKEILYIPSLYSTEWSINMNKIFSNYFFTYNLVEKEESYLRYHTLTFKYYYKFFNKIKNDKSIKNIFLQNIFEDCDWRLFELTDKKIYGYVHSFSNLSINTDILNLRERYIVERCSGLFVGSQYMKNIMIKKGYPGEKIHIIGFPFDNIEDNYEKENILIFNHRLVKNKGYEKFLELIPQFLKRYPDLLIYICVPKYGNSTDTIKRIKEIQDERVIIQFDDGKNYKEILKKAKYGLSLSEFDTFGTSFSYALLNNIFYLVPDKFAFSEIADKDLIYNDENELFKKFDNIYNNYNMEKIISMKKEFLKKYNSEKVVDNIINIIDKNYKQKNINRGFF